MKKYFVDTNIILDFLGNRKPFGKYALAIFNKARLKEWELFTSDNSILTSYYIISKEINESEARDKISGLLNYLEIQPIKKEHLRSAITSGFRDYEDGVQHSCALSIRSLSGIITRNKRDFKTSQLPIYGPEEVLDI